MLKSKQEAEHKRKRGGRWAWLLLLPPATLLGWALCGGLDVTFRGLKLVTNWEPSAPVNAQQGVSAPFAARMVLKDRTSIVIILPDGPVYEEDASLYLIAGSYTYHLYVGHIDRERTALFNAGAL